MKATDPFDDIAGNWIVGTFTGRPGLLNMESSWVGFGGADGAAGLIQGGTAQLNGVTFFWTEIKSSFWDDSGMIPVDGFPLNPGDSVGETISIYDPSKAFPQTIPRPPVDNSSYAAFNFFDYTRGQVISFQASDIDQEWDGSTAEWIDEDPTFPITGGLFTLPGYSYIYWTYAWAHGIYGNDGVPTLVGDWPDLTPQEIACSLPAYNCTGVNNPWRKTYMTYPGTSTSAHRNGLCEVGVSQIYDINVPNEHWYTYFVAPDSDPCALYNP
jgi:hypothetical protein